MNKVTETFINSEKKTHFFSFMMQRFAPVWVSTIYQVKPHQLKTNQMNHGSTQFFVEIVVLSVLMDIFGWRKKYRHLRCIINNHS